MIDYKQATMVLQKKKMCSEKTVLYHTRVKKFRDTYVYEGKNRVTIIYMLFNMFQQATPEDQRYCKLSLITRAKNYNASLKYSR